MASERWPKHGGVTLIGVLALCAAVRLGFLFVLPVDYARLPMDPDGYWQIAGNLAGGHGFAWGNPPRPTAMRPPLYPLLLSGVRVVFGDAQRVGLVLQALLDVGTCLGVYVLGMALCRRQGVALLAALLWAVYLPEAHRAARFWSEPACGLMVTWGLAAFFGSRRSGSRPGYVVAGVLLGLASLARPASLLFAPTLAAWVALSRQATWRSRTHAVVLVVTAGVTCLPWAARNHVVAGVFTPATTHGGFTLYEGNIGLVFPDYLADPDDATLASEFQRRTGLTPDQIGRLPEPKRSAQYRSVARRAIAQHPARYAVLSGVRVVRLWLNVGFAKWPSLKSWGVAAINLALLVAAGAGVVALRRARRDEHVALLLLLAVHTLTYALIIAYVRSTFPVIPALICLSAVGLADAASRIRGPG